MPRTEELIEMVGQDYVQDDRDTLEEYSRDESFAHPIRPLCVVRPGSVEDISAIIHWAKETQTPLVPVSSGRPRFRGDTVPGVGGAVIVDLGRMKKIIRVDRRNRVFMVEPGVTFGEIIPVLKKEGLAPFMPLSPRSTKSVVGSLLEREPITMPRYHWDMQDPLSCVEVVFGNGELFRTGSAAGPGTLEEQWEVGKAQVRPMGPSYTDFAKVLQGSQGTMGIVSWASVVCRPLPELKKTYLVPSERLERVIDLAYKLIWKRIGQDCLILNGAFLSRLASEDGNGAVALQRELPPWVLVFSVEGYGVLPEERLVYQEEEFIETAQVFGLEPKRVLAKVRADTLMDRISNPSDDPYWKIRETGGCHELFFMTTMDQAPSFLEKIQALALAHRYPSADMGVYIQPNVLGCSCHCEFDFPYDPEKEQEKETIKALDDEAARAFANMGAFFCRPYGQWANYAYVHAADTVTVLRKLKNQLFDPQGIMNPGKLCF